MDLESGSFVASLIVSSIGFVAFMYGRKLERVPQIIAGIALMAFPYFVPNVLVMAGIAAALLIAMWVAVRLGY